MPLLSIRQGYLLVYNSLQTIGWITALWNIFQGIHAHGSLDMAYKYAGETVATFQLIAALEIVHAAIGIVGGSPMMSLMQWAGRSNILWGIVRSIPEVQNSLYVGAMLLAWSLSEVIRYPWYAASTLQMCPQWLTWLRYTAFIPLYPIGVIGEMMSAFKALDLLKERGLHSFSMPNFFNMSFDYRGFMICVLCAYPFLWWQLYSTLLRQRAKKLSLSKRNKTD